MTAVGQTLGDPGLDHPARAGRRDVPGLLDLQTKRGRNLSRPYNTEVAAGWEPERKRTA